MGKTTNLNRLGTDFFHQQYGTWDMHVTFATGIRYRFLVHGTDDDEVVVTMCFELIESYAVKL